MHNDISRRDWHRRFMGLKLVPVSALTNELMSFTEKNGKSIGQPKYYKQINISQQLHAPTPGWEKCLIASCKLHKAFFLPGGVD